MLGVLHDEVGLRMDWARQLVQVVRQQIVQTVVIVREIVDYHVGQFRQGRGISRKKKQLRRQMGQARDYGAWQALAQQFDGLKDIRIWKENMHSQYYDYEYTKFLRDQLRQARAEDNVRKVVRLLRSHPSRNTCNVLNPLLYRQCFLGTKSLIESYHEEVRLSLQLVQSAPQDQFSREKKLEFFAETRHAVGRTALLLSGGASLGMYHTGVISCLQREGLLPRVVAGSSAGSIFASFLAVKGPDVFQRLHQFDLSAFQARRQGSLLRRIRRFLTTGTILQITVLQQFLRANLGDVTFQEAYDKTGIILNITVTGGSTHNQDRMLNYLTAPNVLIWSASAASCSIPLIYGASQLYCKHQGEIQTFMPLQRKFLDGSIGADLPMQKLSVMFNVNSFIVSQTNPWVIPFRDTEVFAHTTGKLTLMVLACLELLKELYLSEIRHRTEQLKRLNLVPSFLAKYLNLVTQSYKGDVTIWPVPGYSDYLTLLNNPTSLDQLHHYHDNGMKRTFQKVNYIRSLTRLETLLEEGHRQLRGSLPDHDDSQSSLRFDEPAPRHDQRNDSFLFPRRQQASSLGLRLQ